MTNLTETVHRISAGVVHDAAKLPPVVISLEPPSVPGFRAKVYRKVYKLTAEACYWLAVKAERCGKERQRQKRKRKARRHGAKR